LVSKAVGKLNLIKIEGKIGKIMFITIRFGGAEFFGQRLQTDLLILKSKIIDFQNLIFPTIKNLNLEIK